MILRKIGRVWRERGLIGFCRFIGGRLFARRFHRVLYEIQPAQAEMPGHDGDRRVWIYDSRAAIPEQVLSFVNPGGEEYLENVGSGDLLYAVELDGRLVHYGYVMRRTRETAVLGEPSGTPLIGNCWTRADARGKGIYPYALRIVVSALRGRGVGRVLIETDVDNTASRRGIEKAGFRQLRVYNAWIVCNSLLIGSVEEKGRRRAAAWVIRFPSNKADAPQ